ncbi:MAG TPA: DUF4349 domain-containing protein [Candidatus Dormibacteraeota bacterium]|nr:DUF4349 domain-containing protein [Candidatus Dormibacteraeota bacterium]
MKKLFVTLVVLLAAAACGGAAGSAGSANGGPARLSQGQVGAQPPARSNTGSGQSSSTGAPTTTNPAPTDTVPVLQGPPVIRQAQLAITVDSGKFDQKLADVRTLVEARGGYIAGTDAQANPAVDPNIRTGVINFMVPAANFDATIDEIAKVGKVENEHITGTDVSGQYVDLRTRLDNAQAQRQAMLTLLTQAKTIQDMIAVQTQIGQITGQIEQLEGQIKYLDQNTSFSSISVTMTEAAAPPAQATTSDNWGFVSALTGAAHNFVTTIDYAVTALGALGPFVVVGLVGFLAWRRRRAPLPRHA